ncbi:uncharacterized protein LOC106660296 isoform X1 [Trichogramma pretiosum]|uniref:uncharacterized protein LOC106660296 isoform X1 n=1 Tax=Trichogramma pretiosum TaxID=7493 RepID=UPI000C7190AA|nr:uncharacterized protein LOC106660296 isoform X1 [Trichogramma pretiosum]
MQRKCCAHCPGSVTRTGDPIREHDCGLPVYVSGNLRVRSVLDDHDGHDDDEDEAADRDREHRDEPSHATKTTVLGSCYDRFATAKKFHAENLQHQPLPDRVDDAIFTRQRPALDPSMRDIVKRCQKIVPRRQALLRKKEQHSRAHKYAPALGCKKPKTYMDLAICWETPIDQSYEPKKASHIDGSEGGPAPAIFTLVSHATSQTDVRDGCIPAMKADDDCSCEQGQTCKKCIQKQQQHQQSVDGEDLCRNMDSIRLSNEPAQAKSKRAMFNRHCATCNKGSAAKQRPSLHRVRSTASLEKVACGQVVAKKTNGLPTHASHSYPKHGTQVPRPRTPYARRSFCIDTLAPPFSIVHGCRDADYPEHWRLTSIYQQSYRSPVKMRDAKTIINYDRL